jgi:hypothetical protein
MFFLTIIMLVASAQSGAEIEIPYQSGEDTGREINPWSPEVSRRSSIDSYSVVLYGKGQEGGDLVAYIHCFNDGKNVASCEFYRDATALPSNRYQDGKIWLTYEWSQFEAVLDVLRNETPVSVEFTDSTKVGYITTDVSTTSSNESSYYRISDENIAWANSPENMLGRVNW